MAEATEAQVKTMVQNAIRVYDQLRLAGNVNTGTNAAGNAIYNLATSQETLRSSTVGTYADAVLAAIVSTRNKLATALGDARNAMVPLLTAYAVALGLPVAGGVSAIFGRLFKDAVDNKKRVQSRGFQFGTNSPGGSNAGNGVLWRLNFDENGLVLENQHADAKAATCTVDATTTGSNGRNEEVFEIRGASAGPDVLALAGSGDVSSIAAISARTSILQNASFSQVGGTATVPTSIPGWTPSFAVSAATCQFVTDANSPPTQASNIYRDFPGDSTPYALKVLSTGTWSLSQSLEVNRASLVTNAPYFIQVAYKKSTVGTDGTLSFQLGPNASTNVASQSVALAGIADTNWHLLTVPMDSECWFKNFDGANILFTINRVASTTGAVSLDDILLQPMTAFDGSWYAMVGGTTQFRRNDSFSWTDTELATSSAVLQNWFWRTLGVFYPAAPTAPATGPTVALAGLGAGNVDNGAHTYLVTFVDANGVESAASPTNAVTVTDKTTNGQVAVSAIAVGPSGTASRKVYRSAAGTTTPLHRVTTVSGNVTTTYTDNSSDASIAANAQPPSITMWADPT